jgi:uncharacterized membrane protein
MRKSFILIVVLEAIAAVQVAYFFQRLPPTVASHFGVAGIPNSWETKQSFLGFYAVEMLSIAVLCFIIPQLLFALPPALINLPNKDYWLAPEHRSATLDFMVEHVNIFGAATLALLVCIFQLATVTNLSATPVFPGVPAAVVLAAYGIFVVIWLVLMFRRFRRA